MHLLFCIISLALIVADTYLARIIPLMANSIIVLLAMLLAYMIYKALLIAVMEGSEN